MSHEELKQEPLKLSVEELQKQMAELQERINATQKENGVEPENPVAENVEEKVEELETNYTEGKKIETEKAELTASIERVQSELQKFEDLIKQAAAIGITVENNTAFLDAFQAEKDKLAGLEQKQNELANRAKEIASNPDVMDKLRDDADAEEKDKHDERIREEVEAYDKAKISVSEKLATVSSEILNDAEMIRTFGLENHSTDSLLKLINTMSLLDLSKDKLEETVDRMMTDKFKYKHGNWQTGYKLKDKIVTALENDQDLKKYLEIREKYLNM